MNMNSVTHEELNSFVPYNYKRNLKADILNYIVENEHFETPRDIILDYLLLADSVTGNASGSYTFSRLEASLNLVGNISYLHEMEEEGFYSMKNKHAWEPERIDVAIRCYLCEQCLNEVLKGYDFQVALDEYKEKGVQNG